MSRPALAMTTRRSGPWRVVEANARAVGRGVFSEAFPTLLQPLVLCAVFGGVLALDAAPVRDTPGGPVYGYAAFVVAGVVVGSCVISGAVEAAHLVFVGSKLSDRFRTTVTTPVSAAEVAIGHVLWAALYAGALGTVLLLVLSPFLPSGPTVRIVPVVGLVAVAGGALGAVFGAIVAACPASPQVLNLLGRVLVPPLLLFGATIFPLTTLPDAVRVVLAQLPVAAVVVAARAVLVGAWSDAVVPALVVLAWAVAGTTAFVAGLRRELHR